MATKFTDYIKKNPNARPTIPQNVDWDAQKKIHNERAEAASKAVVDKNKQYEKDNTPLR